MPAAPSLETYPDTSAARDAWILARRPDLGTARASLPVDRPSAWLVEDEPDAAGKLLRTLTTFLTNRECPWRCLMCDLWQHTTLETVPVGAVPRQVDAALAAVSGEFGQLKLYNAGSFFDPRAIPPADHPALAERCRRFARVVVECHPALISERILPFRDQLGDTRLEVALGLETANPEVLARLNKRMTRDDFARAAEFLCRHGLAVRVFLLVKPPFLDAAAALEWTARSVEFAFACGAGVVSLIPTRPGNGALDELARAGRFTPPTLTLFEDAVEAAFARRPGSGRVFADLWDLERFCDDPRTFAARRARLAEVNLRQRVPPRINA